MADEQNNLKQAIPTITKLDQEMKDNISRAVREELVAMQADRSDWLQKKQEHLYQWDDFITPNRTGPWEGSSNIHIPLTMQQVRGFHARMYSILFETNPGFIVIPTKPSDFEKKELVERAMVFATEKLANNNEGVKPAIDRWVWDTITQGDGVVKLRWEERREKFVDTEEEYETVIDPVDNMPYMAKTGNLVDVEKEEVVYSGPIVENIDFLDFYITPGYPIETAPCITQRIRLTANDLHRLADAKTFSKKAVDALLEREGTTTPHTGPESSVIQTRDMLGGVNTASPNRQAGKFYKILESYRFEDVNNDGIEERIVVWIHEEDGEFLGWNYVNRLHKDSRPPFFTMKFIPRGTQPSMSLVELMFPLNTEIDSLHNLRIDSLQIMNVPWGTVKNSRKLKADNIQIAPGVFIPVEEHDDLQIKALPYSNNSFAQEEERLVRHAETLGMSSLGFGQTPGQIGPLATATGATTMLQEMNRVLAVHIDRVRHAYGQLLKGMYNLLKEYMPLDTVMHTLGEDGKPVFTTVASRAQFATGVEFTFAPSTATLNKDMERQSALLWLQTASNPLWVQLGLTSPATLREAAVDVAKSLGKVNISKYLNKQGMEPQPQSLQEEISFLLSGIKPVIVMNDDHEAKINGLIAHRDGPDMEALATRSPNQHRHIAALLEQGIAMHQQMLQALQAQNQSGNISGLNMAPTVENRRAGMPTSAESPEGQGAPVGAGPGMTPGITGSVAAPGEEPTE